jgi:hypothetical protein
MLPTPWNVKVVSASNDPSTVKISPSVTVAPPPPAEEDTIAVLGKLALKAPYAFEPWPFRLRPNPAV